MRTTAQFAKSGAAALGVFTRRPAKFTNVLGSVEIGVRFVTTGYAPKLAALLLVLLPSHSGDAMAVGATDFTFLGFLQRGGDTSGLRWIKCFLSPYMIEIQRGWMSVVSTVTASLLNFNRIERFSKRFIPSPLVCL